MATTRAPRHVRSLVTGIGLAALVGVGLVAVPHLAGADPGPPSISEVNAKLDKLARDNEVLAEQYNKAADEVKADQKAADAAQRAALNAASDFDKARARLRLTVTAEYESSSFSHAGALLTSEDGQSYIDSLNAMSVISSHRAAIVTQIKDVQRHAQQAQKKASALLAAAQAKAAALDKQKSKIEAETKKFRQLLDKLTAAQEAARRARDTVPPAEAQAAIQKPPAGSGKASSAQAQAAVDYAIAQVGKAYVFAGTGPDAFDCSGLTMMAWKQGGISLPHQASEQYNFGTHVDASDLQPGDLVFLYSPISHVEIMVGPDLAVSAANEELGVRYVHPSEDMADFAGATRLT